MGVYMNKVIVDLMEELYTLAKDDVRQEVNEEMNSKKEKKMQCTELAKEMYDKFSYKEIEKHIKRELPLMVRLFNKVTVNGKALLYEDIIQYTYYFNDDVKNVFVYKPHIYDMKNNW